MSVIEIGTKRRLQCIAPVEAVIGKIGKGNAGLYDVHRYGGVNCFVGYQFANTGANRFRINTGKYNLDPTKKASVIAAQAKFAAVSQATSERLLDPQKKQVDKLAWSKQTKYRTLFGYVFHLEWLAYEG